MSFEEQFDKIINNKINESAFPFDEKNWEKASALIDANRLAPIAKNKSKNLLLLSLALLTVSTIAVFTYVQLNTKAVVVANTTKNKISSTNTENLISQANNNNNTPINNEFNSSTSNTLKNLNTQTDSKETVKNYIDNEKTHKSTTIINTNTNLTKKDKHLASQTNTNSQENINTSPAYKTNENEVATMALTKTEENEAIATNKLIATKNYDSNTATKIANANVTNKKLLQKNSVTIFSKINPIIVSTKDNTPVNNKVNSIPEVTKREIIENSKLSFEPLSTITLNVQQDLTNYECKNTNVNFLQAYDNDYFKNTKPKFNHLNLEAGTAYLLGFNTINTKDAVGLNYYAGLNYGIYISKKISVSAGAQFYNVSNIKQNFYTASKTVYEFGSTGSYTNITTNSLYYVSVPIKLNYALSPISKIGLGLNTGFLVGGKNTVETYNLFDGVKANVTTTTNKGYYEGVNTKNVVLSAFYSHKLNKRFNVNCEFMYGISDVYINTKTNTTKQNTIGFKLGLTFTLLDK